MKKQPDMVEMKSSNVAALGFHDGSLFVRFRSGQTYRYSDVPQQIYTDGLGSESPGRWFQDQVRGAFTGEKINGEPDDQ